MEVVIDLLKIVVPAGLVLYGMFLVVRSFLNKDFERRLIDLKSKQGELLTPLRMQAYERMAIFLERIAPSNLITRLNSEELNSAQLHAIMLAEIRHEFNHNLSQQVYMGDEVWANVRAAMDNITAIINESAAEVQPESASIELAKKVIGKVIDNNADFSSQALQVLKHEVRTYF